MGRTHWAAAIWIGVLAVSTSTVAAQAVAVSEFQDAVERFVQTNAPESQSAARLRRMQPTERIPDTATPMVASWGAGPMLQREVERLTEKSLKRPEPSRPVVWRRNPVLAPRIVDGERAVILETVRLYAQDYSQSIPNFLCFRDTHFLSDKSGLGRWKIQTRVGEKLSHLDGEDEHEIVEIDGERVEGDVLLLHGGITVSGEFGNVMRRIFEEETETEFFWLGPDAEGGQGHVLLGFRVKKEHSSMRISSGGEDEEITGYTGEVLASPDTGQIFRIRLTMDELPKGYPMRGGTWDIFYGPVRVEEKELLLPVRAVTEAFQQGTFLRNQATYSQYQKYTSDSSIRFERTDPELFQPKY